MTWDLAIISWNVTLKEQATKESFCILEEVFANYIFGKELVSGICKELLKLTNKKQTTQLKNSKSLK